MQLRPLALLSCAENQLSGLSFEAVFGFGHGWGSEWYSVVDLTQDLRFRWQIGSIALVIFNCQRLAGRNRLAMSHRRGTVLLITTLPRTVDPRVQPLKSIVLDRRRGQKVWALFGHVQGRPRQQLGMHSVQQGNGFCQSTRACVLPCPRAIAGDLCLVGMHMLRVVKF